MLDWQKIRLFIVRSCNRKISNLGCAKINCHHPVVISRFFFCTGSRKCECGLLGVCFDPDKWCNCDSGHDDWLWDGGEITQKEYLPVRALHFGDTGNPLDRKEGRYSLGPLECDGDVLFDNVVTFRYYFFPSNRNVQF